MKIIDLLLKAGCSIHFIGDLDQSIYSFKGVYPENIRSFIGSNNFPTLILADNFRSIQQIVNVCSKIIGRAGITGHQTVDSDYPTCIYYTYDREEDMAILPERFKSYLSAHNIRIENSAVLARNYNTLGKLRSHGDSRDKSLAYYPAIAINNWSHGHQSLEQMEEAVLTMGKLLAEKLFPSVSSSSQKYYCPEKVSSIEWRMFIARTLDGCCCNEGLVNFQQTWSSWGNLFRQNIENILCKAKSNLDTINLPKNIQDLLGYRVPQGQSNARVIESLQIPRNHVERCLRITTFHKIKGETLDGAMIVSSRTAQGGGGGYWQTWLKDQNSEEARFAYVASSRPRYLLAWGIPLLNLDSDKRNMLEQLGFTEAEK